MATRRDSFKNLDEFGALIEGLDDYEKKPVSVATGDQLVHSDRIHVMFNVTRGHPTMPVGKNYPVFGHREALGYVNKELVKANIGVHGFIDTVGDRTYTRILFDGIALKDDAGDKNVEIGVSFENPMDRKTRFRGYGYTWRQTCSNGAGIRRMLPIMEINERHTSDMEIRVPPIIHKFMLDTFDQTNHLQSVIESAQKVRVEFDSREQIFQTMKAHFDGVTERHIKRIAEQVTVSDPTRYDLYNAATFVTSHSPVSQDIKSVIDLKAEAFLDMRIPIVPVTVVVKVEPEEEIIKRPRFTPDDQTTLGE